MHFTVWILLIIDDFILLISTVIDCLAIVIWDLWGWVQSNWLLEKEVQKETTASHISAAIHKPSV